MKKAYLSLLFLLITFVTVYADGMPGVGQDTATVDLLIKQGFTSRMTDHDQTIRKAQQGLELAQKLNYVNGIAEAYRVLGLGEYYANHEAKAISYYLYALQNYKISKNIIGQSQVYNNIGNLYQTSDYDKSLEYLEKGLKIAQTL